MGPTRGLGALIKGYINILPLPGIQTLFLKRPPPSALTVPTWLPRLLLTQKSVENGQIAISGVTLKKNWQERRDRKAGIHDPYSSGGKYYRRGRINCEYNDGTCSTHDRRKECIQSLILKNLK